MRYRLPSAPLDTSGATHARIADVPLRIGRCELLPSRTTSPAGSRRWAFERAALDLALSSAPALITQERAGRHGG